MQWKSVLTISKRYWGWMEFLGRDKWCYLCSLKYQMDRLYTKKVTSSSCHYDKHGPMAYVRWLRHMTVSVPCKHTRNMQMSMYVWKWICKWACMYIYYVNMCVYVCVYVCGYVHVRVCVCMCVCVHTGSCIFRVCLHGTLTQMTVFGAYSSNIKWQ